MSKSYKANLELNVGFVTDAKKLVKNLESDLKQLDFTPTLSKPIQTNLNKTFKEIYSSLDKMGEGLNKKGFNSKQYATLFTSFNTKIETTVKELNTLRGAFEKAFNSDANKDALKNLEKYKETLKEVRALMSKQQGYETRANTSKSKLKDMGLDLDNKYTAKVLRDIMDRRASGNKSLTAKQSELLGNNTDPDKLKRVITLIEQYNSHLQETANITKQIQTMTDSKGSSDTIANELEKNIKNLEKSAITTDNYKQNLQVLTQTEEQFAEVTDLNNKLLRDFEGEMPRAAAEAEKMANAQRTIREVLGQFGIVLSAATVVRTFKELFESAMSFYKSLDTALNQIYVVSNLSSDAVDGLKTNFINIAKETGMAIDDITQGAVLFYQQGLNTDEVLTMTEVTAQFAKVAGIDAADAADKLTAAVNGYCLAAEDASSVADKFNKVAADTAADIDELSTAFSKAAAQANQAGVSMDNYLAYIATMEEATREAPENIGTSLKTIFSRMQQIKELGSAEDDTSVTLNSVQTALRAVGVELTDTTGELRNLEDVFAELGPMWKSLDRNTQAYLGTIIAGTRQQSRFITLMQNWDRVLEVAEASENSAGQQALMHAKAMESVESKLQQLNVAWQEFISNLTSSSVIKNAINSLTKLLKLFNNGNKPITLMATAIGLLSTKLKDLQAPLVKKITDVGKSIKGFGKDAISAKEKAAQLNESKVAITKQENIIKEEEAEIRKLMTEEQQLLVKKQLTDEEQDTLAQLDKQITTKTDILDLDQRRLKILKEENIKLKEQNTSWDIRGKSLVAIGTAVNAMSLAIGQADDNLAGLVGTVGSLAVTIGQIFTGNYIGAAVTLVTTLMQAFNTKKNWESNIASKLTNAVEKVNSALDELNRKTTTQKSTKKLIDQYNELSHKMYKTAEEQDQLNSVVQQLGDSLDIETITDGYGNLSINIDAVTQSYKNLADEAEDALKKMKEIEAEQAAEATKGLGNNTSIYEAYKEIYNKNKGEYKSLLSGINDTLNTETREISNSLYNTIDEAFKTNIEQHINEYIGFYTEKGLTQSMVDMQKDINTKLQSNNGWEYVYEQIEELQRNVEDMSWEDFTVRLDEMFTNWRSQIKLTQDEWLVLKGVIEDTVYGDKQYTDFMTYYQDKYKPEDSENMALYLSKLEEYRNRYNSSNITGMVVNGSGKDYKNTDTSDFNEMYEYWKKHKFKNDAYTGNAVGDFFRRSNGVSKNVRLMDKDFKDVTNVWGPIFEELYNLENEYEKASNEMSKGATALYEAMSTAKGKNRDKLINTGSIFDVQQNEDFYKVDENGKVSQTEEQKQAESQYGEIIANAIEQAKDMVTESDIALTWLTYINEQLAKGDLKPGVQPQLEKVKKEIESEMPRTGEYTWAGINDTVNQYTKDLKVANQALEELNENGYIADDTFGDLAQTLDSLSLEDVFESFDAGQEQQALDYIDGLIQAMKDLDVEYDINTGAVKVNAEALEYVRDAQERAAKGKINAMIKDLAASKASAEMQVGYIDAQIAAIDAMINYINAQGEATISTDAMMAQADAEYGKVFGNVTDNVTQAYTDLTGDSAKWATATIHNIAAVTSAWSKYWQAVRSGSSDVNAKTLLEDAKKVTDGYFKSTSNFAKATNIDLSGINGLKGNSTEAQNKVAELQTYKSGLLTAREKYAKTVSLYQGRIEFLQSIADSDLSKLGTSGGKQQEQKITQYIGQLEEIYNVMRKIEGVEERISNIDAFMKIATGADYANYALEKVNDTQEKYLLNLQRIAQQKYREQIEQEQIKSSAVSGVFGFDQYGNIIVDWDKYEKLSDKTIDGMQSQKELADQLYNEYESLHKETMDYYNDLIQALEDAIQAQQDLVDIYNDFSHKLADAVKDIYQEMLDNKLKAIDTEIDALDKLAEAYDRANQAANDSKDLSGMQTSMKRAMMDTSGASNTKVLDYRDQINSKLESMGQNAYTQRLDDIKELLEEQKDSLQEDFDMFFEDWEQLFQLINEHILPYDTAVADILKTTQDYKEGTDAERYQLLEDAASQYKTIQETLNNSGSIMNVVRSISDMSASVVDIDEMLRDPAVIEKIGTELSRAIKEYNNSLNKYASGGLNTHTGPAWLDGTSSAPEAVLNAAQTQAFMSLTSNLAKLDAQGSGLVGSNVIIDNISFEVESMSSPEDGEKAFDAFINRFKEIGSQTGLSFNKAKI